MINDDMLSLSLSIMAVVISLYLSTLMAGVVLFPTILLLGGWSLEHFLLGAKIRHDEAIEEERSKNFVIYTVLGLVTIVAGGYAIKVFYPAEIQELSIVDKMLFGQLMAIAEERFFRGFFTNFFTDKLRSPVVGIIVSAVVFVTYHIVYYGNTSALAYVFVGGIALAAIGLGSGHLSSPIIVHCINNLLAAA